MLDGPARLIRARRGWIAAGAAVTVLLGAGGIGAALTSGNGTSAHASGTIATTTTRAPTTLAPTTAAPTSTKPVTTTRPTTPPTVVTPAARLAPRLAAAMAGFSGCLVVQDGGTTIYSHNAGLGLAPASTEKLLTAAAALTRLGPGFRFETDVVAAAAPSGGTVSDLWLVGAGDPTLASPEYAAFVAQQPELVGFPSTSLSVLADGLAGAGVRTVTNGIHGDDSRYDRTRYLPSWPAFYATEVDIGPLSALSVNQGLTSWSPKPVTAPDPTAFAASELARLLGPRHVQAAGAADGVAPAHPVVLARVLSAPLSTIVAEMLRISDNYSAEMLTRELGRRIAGSGTTAAGTAVITQTAAALGLPTAGLHLVDGSGLDRGNRSTCQLELAALNLGTTNSALGALSSGLAVAGQSGTLINRYLKTPFQGHLEAKTGSLDGVMGMVGHEEVGHPLRFALIVNGLFTWPQGSALEDRVVAALATYPN